MPQARLQSDAPQDPFLWNRSLSQIVLSQPEAGQYPLPSLGRYFLESEQSTGGLGFEIAPWSLVHQSERREIALTREIENCLETLRRRGICFGKIEEIREYMLQFPDMIEVALVATQVARKYLSEAQLTLEVYRDPEIEDRHLVLYVRLEQYDQSVMERIREVRKEYRRYLFGKKGWLHLTTDFCLNG